MKRQIVRNLLICSALTIAARGQSTYQRQAAMVGGGSADRGKCTVEVFVDDVAQVEIRGGTATVRNISGQPAQLRRFECTSTLPANPPNFRFQGIDGRGRQTLIRDPRNGGVAIVQIEDKDGGSEGYTFDLLWDAGGVYDRGPGPVGGNNNQGYQPNGQVYRDDRNRDRNDGQVYRDDRNGDRNDGQYRPNYRDSDYYRRYNHGFATEEAVRVCQQAVANQATQRFPRAEVHFYRTSIDNNPGRQDWVMGTLDIHRGNRMETYNFSCAVDFDSGRVRNAQLDARPMR
jgi:hypothetical protein